MIVPQKQSRATEQPKNTGPLQQGRPQSDQGSVTHHWGAGQLPHREQASTSQSSVDLTIDELVLHGFSHIDRGELGAEVERALSQLFVERGTPSALHGGGEVDRLEGGTFSTQPTSNVYEIARQIAQAIYQGFG